MLGILWLGLILVATIFSIFQGTTGDVVAAVTDYAKLAIQMLIGLLGIMMFWLGLMKIAEEAGLIKAIANVMSPLFRRLFPEVPKDDPALAAIVLNVAANMFGLNNAATPLGLRAMQALERLNKHPGVASNAMCMLLAINTSSVQLIPTSTIAYLAAAGARSPTAIIVPSLLATLCSTIMAIIAVKIAERWPCFRRHEQQEKSS